jgi:hypothetical protein
LSRGRFRTDGRTNDRTMAAVASVTWTHCSVLFEVTWDKTRCVRADATMRLCRRTRVRADAKKIFKNKNKNKLLLLLFLVVVAGLEGENFFSFFNFRFSVFNPQNPQNPQNPETPETPQTCRTPRTPRTPRAPRAKPREEEGFFGLVPLVTHASSIPLLGGLTPKFLSLSLHSL